MHQFNTMSKHPLDLSIIYQTEDFVVINKNINDSFHVEDNKKGVFAETQALLQCKLWPVHRLDKMTSGILLFAKSKEAAKDFSHLFYQHQVEKSYLAISNKKPKKKQGLIKGGMEKSRNGCWKLNRSTKNLAITQFTSQSIGNGYRLYRLKPQTGKTHQLRVAMKSLGSPILGDKRYGGSDSDRGYLHAYQIAFTWQNQFMQFTAPINSGALFLSDNCQKCLNTTF